MPARAHSSSKMWRWTARPARAAVLDRPARRHPALARQDLVPADVVVLGQAQVVQHLVAQVGRQLGLQEGAHLVAEGQVLGRVVQVHAVSSCCMRCRRKKARPFQRLYLNIRGRSARPATPSGHEKSGPRPASRCVARRISAAAAQAHGAEQAGGQQRDRRRLRHGAGGSGGGVAGGDRCGGLHVAQIASDGGRRGDRGGAGVDRHGGAMAVGRAQVGARRAVDDADRRRRYRRMAPRVAGLRDAGAVAERRWRNVVRRDR